MLRSSIVALAACSSPTASPIDGASVADSMLEPDALVLGPTEVAIVAPRSPDAVIAYRTDGAWTVVNGSASPVVFTANDRYSVAISCPHRGDAIGYELTRTETNYVDYDRGCEVPAAVVTLSGQFTGGAFQRRVMTWGSSRVEVQNVDGPNAMPYELASTAGKHDLIAGASGLGPGCCLTFANLTIQRDLEVSTSKVIDLDVTMSAIGQITYDQGNIAAEMPTVFTRSTLITSNGTRFLLYQDDAPNRALATYVDSASVLDSDRHETEVSFLLADRYVVTHYVDHGKPTNLGFLRGEMPTLLSSGASWTPQPDAAAYRLDQGSWTVYASRGAFESTLTPPVVEGSGWVEPEAAAPSKLWAGFASSVGDAIREERPGVGVEWRTATPR